jgi:multidrug transporter EmrE-like cation transporter
MGFTDIVALSVAEIFGDFSFRWYAQENAMKYFWGGIAGYIGVIYYLIRSFRHDNVLYVNGMWDGISGLIESVAAFVILGDRLENPIQYVGLVMVVIGIVLLKKH